MNVIRIEIHPGGVIDVCKSGGVRSLIQSETDAAAARCNGLVQWRSPMNSPAFKGYVDDGSYTAIGKVTMNRGLGRDGMAVEHYEAKHAVLLRGSGW